MESIGSVQGRITGHFGLSPFTSGADVDWPGFSFPTIAQVIDTVCRRYEISRVDLLSDRRTGEIIFPRHIAIYLCRKLTPFSFPQIGRAFRRDHSTAMHSYSKVCERMEAELAFKNEIESLAMMVGGRQ